MLLVLMVACPFTAPFRICTTKEAVALLGSGSPHAVASSHVVRLEPHAPVAAAPSAVADDSPDDVWLAEHPFVLVETPHVMPQPFVAAFRDVPRPVFGTLRL